MAKLMAPWWSTPPGFTWNEALGRKSARPGHEPASLPGTPVISLRLK